MSKQRQSNFELLRIILMIAIPLYHLMLYSGMNHLPYNTLTLPSLMICSGGAIVADYAFMSLSAYFFLDSKQKPIISRMLSTLMQVLFMYVIKMLVLRVGLGFDGTNIFYEAFLVQGSWWFIKVYFVILLIYPILNKLIYRMSISALRILCIVFGIWFIYNGITYNAIFINDLAGFLFTYFVIGYLKRTDFRSFIGIRNKKSFMLMIYVVGYLATLGVCLYLKYPGHMESDVLASEIVRHLVGRYSFPQFLMGIAVFLLFRSISIPANMFINGFAKNVFYVFLLHETVMGVFWYFGKLIIVDNQLPYDSVLSMCLWSLLYLGCTFIFAGIIRALYEFLFKKPIEYVVTGLSNYPWIKKLETKYLEWAE